MSADEPAVSAALRARFGLTYAIVTDTALAVAERYGVRQKDMDLALPATFVVGTDGRVRFVHVAKNPVDRLRTPDLLKALDAAGR